MASYEFSKVIVERYEWSVPAGYGGACWVEVSKAIRAAHTQLWDMDLYPINKDVPDDVIRIIPRDEDVVVVFTLERRGENVRIA